MKRIKESIYAIIGLSLIFSLWGGLTNELNKIMLSIYFLLFAIAIACIVMPRRLAMIMHGSMLLKQPNKKSKK